MKKFISVTILAFILIFTAAGNISADGTVAEASATLLQDEVQNDYRSGILRSFFAKNNSPLEPYSEYFVKVADENNLDWRLIPAITGVESTYGKYIPSNSYNAYGWANGKYTFASWENSLDIVAFSLRENYIEKGAITINQIARIYAPPSSTWAFKVKYIMNKIDPLALEYSL